VRPAAAAARRTTRRAWRLLVVALTSLAAMAATSLAFADGIDVSHWQGSINWTKVKAAGMQFAFMKATESTTYTDTAFATNWAAASSVGMYRGAYHFARPKVGTAPAQAQYFVSRVGSFQGAGTLPPVLDLEASGGLSVTALRSWTATWLTTVEQLTGRTPIIYVSPAFWEHYLGDSTAFTRFPLWIAHYGVSSPRVPGGWGSWTFWQRTSSGSVNGISGNVDMNEFNGTTAQLATLANTTGGSTAPVPPGPTVPGGESTSLSAAAAATTVPAGTPVAFSGDLIRALDSTPLPGRPVQVWSRAAGASAWRQGGTVTTDAAGHYGAVVSTSTPTDFQLLYPGDGTMAASASPVVRIGPPAAAPVTIYLHKNKASRVRKGTKVMIYGHIKTAAAPVTGRYVKVYKRPARGGRWVYVRRTKSLAPTGWYSTTVQPRRSTTYKAVSYASSAYRSGTSNRVTVWVR
jgi:GH25 family lysozyme M1 (1,4-beta-N-acetylmuramidase)